MNNMNTKREGLELALEYCCEEIFRLNKHSDIHAQSRLQGIVDIKKKINKELDRIGGD